MIKVRDGYAKLINTSYTGDISQVLLSNGGTIGYDVSTNTILATIGSNVASADKLKNKVKIWGQDFDGSSDVAGDLLLGSSKILGEDSASIVSAGDNHLVLGYGYSEKGWSTYLDGNSTYFRYGTSHLVGMFLDSSGKVGIGTISPSAKLHVIGVTQATNFISGDGVNDFSAGTVKLDTLNIPTSSGGTTFGPGSNGQVLKSNGTTVYWASDNNSQTGIYAGASGTAENSAATSPYIKIADDTIYRNQIRLLGSGKTSVASDASGNVTVSSTWRDITDTYIGTATDTSLSQAGANALYNALLNGYADEAGNASTLNGLTYDQYYIKYNDNLGYHGQTLSSIKAIDGDANAWNSGANTNLKLSSGNNAIVFTVNSTTNDRRAAIQVGHSDTSYASHTGILYLNPLGGDVITDTIQINKIKAPTTSGGTTYGLGTAGQVLKTNGTSVYWGEGGAGGGYWANLPIQDIPNTSTSPTFANTHIKGIITLQQGEDSLYRASINMENNYLYIQPRLENSSYNYNTVINPKGGNVGIGTVGPQQKLDVAGKVKADALYLTRTNGDVAFTIANEASTNGFNISATGGSSYIRFYTNNGGSSSEERMRIHTNGFVGIGTPSPNMPLTVNGATWINSGGYINNRATLILNSNDTANNAADIIFKKNNTTTGTYGHWAISARYDSTYRFSIFRGAENGSIASEAELFTLRPDGDVDIKGTLNLWNTTCTQNHDEGIRLHASSAGWNALVFCGTDNTGDVGTSAKTWGIYTNIASDFFINKNSSSGLTTAVLCNVSNNWGIGTTSPSYKLQVNGQVYSSGYVRSGSSDSYVLLGGGGHKAVSDFAPASHSHSYVSTGGMVNGAYAVIPTYNGETGWHRIATIDGGTGYGSWILYLCGNWSWASNTSAILHINTMHTTAKITQVSGIVGFVTDVRLVPISNNNYYVDVYINYSGANAPGTVYCYFLGNGAIATRTTVKKITASVSTAASITLVTGTKTNDNSYAAHFYENSDVMLKTNIKSITDSDNMPILKSFNWKSDGSHGYGLIAQELEAMGYPELVSGEQDGTKTVNYSAALSLIVGKLQVKIKELEKEIEILKNKN